MKRTPEEQARWLSELPSHRLAFEDVEFLHRDELRPVRLQLELLKPELLQQEQGIVSTIVVFGSARTDPDGKGSQYYEEARQFAALVSEHCQARGIRKFVITTGGGPGIMEAANRGAHDVGAKSIGLNIEIPHEQVPNPYITPELCFSFHYFALRKMHFLLRAKALVIFPGGFGTLDELFDALTLIQTEKMERMPIVLVGSEYWHNVLNLDYMVEQGTISPEDVQILSYVDRAEEAWQVIRDAYPDELG
ncbi:MAG: TIGR00730 family Rossman fold protein [Acidobacteriota bacterium]|jgi:uncharacterized protein (TIGR00730 family)